MPAGKHGSRTQVWLESLGRLELAGTRGSGRRGSAAILGSRASASPRASRCQHRPHLCRGAASECFRASSRAARRRPGGGLCATLALNGPAGLERLVGAAPSLARLRSAGAGPTAFPTARRCRLPTLRRSVATRRQLDRRGQLCLAGAARRQGSFLVYLPPATRARPLAIRSSTCSTETTSPTRRSFRSGCRARSTA